MAKKGKKEAMTQDELASICAKEFELSVGSLTEIQSERSMGNDYYNQEKFGNEEEGLSQFVTSDVRDTVEWIMPQLVDIFVGGDTPVVFNPENEEDVDTAETESQYCQYVFARQNKGVILSTVWFKDALIEKNGVVKAYWDESETSEREEYKGKTGQEYLALKQDKEFEIEECTIIINDKEYDEKEYTEILQALPSQAADIEAAAEYHIVGHRKRKIGRIVNENVPPEYFFVKKGHNSIFLKDAAWCCEVSEWTRSELVEDGYDQELVDSLPTGTIADLTGAKFNRDKKEGGSTTDNASISGIDRSREIVVITDHYVRADFNNDGIAELRHVRTADRGDKHVLENEEVDRNIYHSITPYLNNYKYHGRSVAQNLFDLVRAKSQLMRSMFDNVMYSTIQRKIVSGNVDIEALLSYVPGGVITKDVGATVENENTPFVANEVFPIIGNMDVIRAERTGFSKETMGLDPSALANATNPVGMAILAQSQLLIKMIATIFAHTGFQSLMEHNRELILKYEKKEKIFDLTGKFLTTDPRSWRKQRDSTVKVGIGYAGKNEELSLLNNLMGIQETFVTAQGGVNGALTNAKGIYNTVKRLCKRMGVKDASNYFQDPDTYQPPQPQPSLAEIQLKASIENMNNQQKIQQGDKVLKMKQMKADHDLKFAEMSQKERLEMKKIASQEKLAELELLYKYGKDAHESVKHHIDSVNTVVETLKTHALKKTEPKPEKPDTSSKTLEAVAKKLSDGIVEMNKTQQAGHKELIKAVTKPKKVTINRGKNDEITGGVTE